MNKETKEQIKEIFFSCINNTLKRTKINKTHRPFHTALLSEEIIKASSFDRSFSSSFGMGPIEAISKIISSSTGAEVERQKETMVNIYKGAIDEIERILSSLRSGEKKPNWNQEIKKVMAYNKGDTEVRRIISDLWIKKEEQEYFISIKTVKPNLDQTEIAKKDLLFLKAHNVNYQTYLGLFYNPGGPKKEDYNWSIPSKIFDMKNDPCVLIGEDYWNLIGGKNTYNQLLETCREVGEETRKLLLKLN